MSERSVSFDPAAFDAAVQAALQYSRDYWKFGTEPETQHALAVLASALERTESWEGLMQLLGRYYPTDLVPTEPDREDRDPGARIVSLIRQLNDQRNAAAVYLTRALTAEETLRRVQELVMNTDGEYLDGSDFDGLAGELQAVLSTRNLEAVTLIYEVFADQAPVSSSIPTAVLPAPPDNEREAMAYERGKRDALRVHPELRDVVDLGNPFTADRNPPVSDDERAAARTEADRIYDTVHTSIFREEFRDLWAASRRQPPAPSCTACEYMRTQGAKVPLCTEHLNATKVPAPSSTPTVTREALAAAYAAVRWGYGIEPLPYDYRQADAILAHLNGDDR